MENKIREYIVINDATGKPLKTKKICGKIWFIEPPEGATIDSATLSFKTKK